MGKKGKKKPMKTCQNTGAPDIGRLREITDWAEEFLTKEKFAKETVEKVLIAVDEIFANICYYSKATEVTVTCSVEQGAARISFWDNGIPYNPLETPPPDMTQPIQEREIGGLGIYLMRKIMDQVIYEYVHVHSKGKNQLTIVKHKQKIKNKKKMEENNMFKATMKGFCEAGSTEGYTVTVKGNEIRMKRGDSQVKVGNKIHIKNQNKEFPLYKKEESYWLELTDCPETIPYRAKNNALKKGKWANIMTMDEASALFSDNTRVKEYPLATKNRTVNFIGYLADDNASAVVFLGTQKIQDQEVIFTVVNCSQVPRTKELEKIILEAVGTADCVENPKLFAKISERVKGCPEVPLELDATVGNKRDKDDVKNDGNP